MSTGDDTESVERFAPLRRFLPMVERLFGGEAIGVREIMAGCSVSEPHARRVYRLLKVELRLKERMDGRRSVAFRAADASVGVPDRVGMLAIEMASAAMSMFEGSEIFERWREIAGRAAESAPEGARQVHDMLERAVHYVHGPRSDLVRVGDTLSTILDALVKRQHLEFLYKGSSEAKRLRLVEPWTLTVHDGIFYLVARDTSDGVEKLWRLDMMSNGRRIKKSFTYPNRHRYHPSVFFGSSVGVWVGGPEAEWVTLEFHSPMVDYAQSTHFHRTEAKSMSEHGVLVRMKVRVTPELERLVLGFGEHCVVIEPSHLVASISSRLAVAARAYQSA